jgi:LPXTG-motif cell wall-anchored protein
VFGTFLVIPDYRLKAADKTILTFHERPVGSPEAIRAWFYPGHNVGHEFVYPKQEARTLAQLNDVPVPAVAEELTPKMNLSVELSSPRISELIIAPVIAEEPGGKEVAVEEAFQTEPPSAEEATTPAELPETGSSLPLIALIGAVSLAGAGMVSRLK